MNPSIPHPSPSRRATRAALLVAILASNSCTEGDSTASNAAWTVGMDTLPGGIPRVLNIPPGDEPAAASAADFTLQEELRIGVMEGDGPDVFGEVKGLVVMEDGLVAVLDAQAQEVRVFERDGTHRITHGGTGEGPGEFTEANGLMLSPEGELHVPDHGNGRMSFFHPRAGFRDSRTMPVLSYSYIWQGAMLGDGRVLKPSIAMGPPRRNIIRIHGPEMTPLDSVFLPDAPASDPEDPPTSFYWEAPGGMPRGYMSVPFSERGAAHFHPDGTVWRSPALADSHRLVRSTLQGDTTLVVETRRPAIPIDPAVRESAIAAIRDAITERGGDIGDQSWNKVPTTYPFVERIFSDDEGNLWVEAGTPSGSWWDVYGRDGVHLRTVETDLTLLPWVDPVVRGDEVWMIVTDEFEIPYVVRAAAKSSR